MVAELTFPGLDDRMADRVRRMLQSAVNRGFSHTSVPTRDDALAWLFEMIPKGASVEHWSSTTLKQVGFVAR